MLWSEAGGGARGPASPLGRLGLTRPRITRRNTGRGISGLTSSTNLKKWALGKEFKADPWQGFTSPQFQDLLAKMGDDGEKECE